MKLGRTLERKIKIIVDSGRGRFYENAQGKQIFFSTVLEDGVLEINEDGLYVISSFGVQEILFKDFISVASYLKKEMFTEGLCRINSYLALDLIYTSGVCSISLPFSTYSVVMIILIEFKELWKVKRLDDV